jgi:hypothetical protein
MKSKKNIGTLDKAIRIFVALVTLSFYYAGVENQIIATTLLSLTGMFMGSSVMGFCIPYEMLGIDTVEKSKKLQSEKL